MNKPFLIKLWLTPVACGLLGALVGSVFAADLKGASMSAYYMSLVMAGFSGLMFGLTVVWLFYALLSRAKAK